MNFVWSGLAPAPANWPVFVALSIALLAIVYSDFRFRKIPNFLVVVIALGGLAWAAASGGVRGAGLALSGGAAGVGLLYLQFARGLMGPGDVKLLGAIGTFTGPVGVVAVLLCGSVLGGVLALLALALAPPAEREAVTRNLSFALVHRELPVPSPAEMPRARGVPYGIPLVVTAFALLLVRCLALR